MFSASLAAMAKQADGKLPLLPSGTLMQRTLDEVDVVRDGKTQKVRLLAVTGQGFDAAICLDHFRREATLVRDRVTRLSARH